MNALKRPDRLFRYFPPEASDFFAEKKLWLSSLKDFNDPFDALPRFDIMLEKQKQRGIEDNFKFLLGQSLVTPADKPAFIKDISETSSGFFSRLAEATAEEYRTLVSNDYRLVCFSEIPDDLLMWGHYAKGHTGFVIEFDPEHNLFSNEEFGRVCYPEITDDERPDVESLDQQKRELWRILFIKSRHWSYEREWRLWKLTTKLPPPAARRDKKLKHYLDISVDLIRAVYFGWQMPPTKHAEIIESLKLPEWKDVKNFVMRPDAAKYGVQPVPFDEWLNVSREFEEYEIALANEIHARTQVCA